MGAHVRKRPRIDEYITEVDGKHTRTHIDSSSVDSLVALELRNWFAREVGADVSVFQILGNESINDLGLKAAGRSCHCQHCPEGTAEKT